MEVEASLGIAEIVPAFSLEGIADYAGRMTHETLVQAHGHLRKWATHMANAAGAAPDEATALVWRANYALPVLMCPRHHILEQFCPVAMCGEGGAYLRETIERCGRPPLPSPTARPSLRELTLPVALPVGTTLTRYIRSQSRWE